MMTSRSDDLQNSIFYLFLSAFVYRPGIISDIPVYKNVFYDTTVYFTGAGFDEFPIDITPAIRIRNLVGNTVRTYLAVLYCCVGSHGARRIEVVEFIVDILPAGSHRACVRIKIVPSGSVPDPTCCFFVILIVVIVVAFLYPSLFDCRCRRVREDERTENDCCDCFEHKYPSPKVNLDLFH